jgi:microcystin-dependent protein
MRFNFFILVTFGVLALTGCSSPVLNPNETSPSSTPASSTSLLTKEAAAGNASDGELATLGMFPLTRALASWVFVRGQQLELDDDTAALFSLLGCTWGCTADNTAFTLPQADGPLSLLGKTNANTGPLLWQMVSSHESYPDGGPTSAYPNQVYFTAAQGDRRGFAKLTDDGFVRLDVGTQVGRGIEAWLAPSSWPLPTEPILSELRLFRTDTALPAGWLAADGRRIPGSRLATILSDDGFAESGVANLPNLAAVGNYTWAIAEEGTYPFFE